MVLYLSGCVCVCVRAAGECQANLAEMRCDEPGQQRYIC